jgi:hypothetical protein
MKKVKIAYRFGDINDADKFIDDNKVVYDEILVLFDTLVEEQPQKTQKEQKHISKPIQQEEIETEAAEYQEEQEEDNSDEEIEKDMYKALIQDKEDLKRRLDSYEKKFGKEKKEIPLPPKPLRAGEKEVKKKQEIINIRV